MEVKVQLNAVSQILRDHGVTPDGDVQKFLTLTINRRIGRYMPHVTGLLETKQKMITSPTTIEVISPAARYLYYGKKMRDEHGRGPFQTKDGEWRYRRGSRLHPIAENLEYDRTFNAQAGPFWDRRLMAAEKQQIGEEVTAYANTHR